MKYILIAALFALLFPSSILAQEAGIEIVCSELRPDYDLEISAKYIPDVDLKGGLVVPADIGDPVVLLREYIDIPVKGDFINIYDIELMEGVAENFELDTEVAGVRIYNDGRVEYNGRNLTEIVRAKCNFSSVADEAERDISVQKLQQDGQNSHDGLESAPDSDTDAQHID